MGAVAAAEQKPCLHTAQEAAAVLHPVFTGGQAAAVVLHDQVQILVVPGEPDLDLPAGAYGPQGVGKQMKQQLLGLLGIRLDIAAPERAVIHGQSDAQLLLDLRGHLGGLHQDPAQVYRLHGRLVVHLHFQQTHHFPQGALQADALLPHILQRLPGPFVSGPGQMHLQVFPVLVHDAQGVQQHALKLFAGEIPHPALFCHSVLSLFSHRPAFRPCVPLSINFWRPA